MLDIDPEFHWIRSITFFIALLIFLYSFDQMAAT